MINLLDWVSQDFKSPQVIKFGKAPLTDLLVHRYLKDYNIDADKILNWVLPLSKNYCATVNSAQSGRSDRLFCSASDESCGGKCAKDQVCRNLGGEPPKSRCGKLSLN